MADFIPASKMPLPNVANGVKGRQQYDLLKAFYNMAGAGGDYSRVFGDDAFTDDQARFKAVADRVAPGAFDELSGMDPMDVMAGYGISSPEAQALVGLAGEGMNNASAMDLANWQYDSQQPYGFNFEGDHGLRFVDPGNAENAFMTRPDGSMMSNQGQIMSTPDGYNATDGDDLALPILRTAGSYALPMLFSMLMRGGK